MIRLLVPRSLADAVVAHAKSTFPVECCGVLAGTLVDGVGTVAARHPVRNDLASPTAFSTNAKDLLAATRAIRAAGHVELAIYHSHPTSAPVPSARDVADNTWGEIVAHVIVSLADNRPAIRAWMLGATDIREVEWAVDETRAETRT